MNLEKLKNILFALKIGTPKIVMVTVGRKKKPNGEEDPNGEEIKEPREIKGKLNIEDAKDLFLIRLLKNGPGKSEPYGKFLERMWVDVGNRV